MRIGGGGSPSANARGCSPSPKPPPLPPARFLREDETLRRRCRFPRGNRPPGTRKKESPEASQRDNRVSNSKSPPVWRAFLLIRKASSRKNLSPPDLCRTSRDRKTGTPAFPAPCSVASKRTSHKEGTTRLPILRLRVRAKRAAATEKEATTPHESGAAQRLEKGERLPGTCCGHRKTRPLNASHEPFPRAFSV